MSLQEQNRLFQILHKNKVTRTDVKKIMKDLGESGIFNDPDTPDDDWESVDEKAEIWFSDLPPAEKLEAIRNINIEVENQKEKLIHQDLFETEKRVQRKMREMEELGLVKINKGRKGKKKSKSRSTTRYGRTPLHEAIAMRNLRLVKKYIRKKLYLTCIDNNGHTPMEMAHYEGYKEAMVVFKAHQSKK